jgi:lipopolysaccharide export system protein LptA
MNLISKFYPLLSVFLVSLLLISNPCQALVSDMNAALLIDAKSADYNFKTGVDTYSGDVKIDQGSTHIRADKVITKKDSRNRIDEAVAYGNSQPAHYWTLPNRKEPVIHAYAKIIKFYPTTSNAVLQDNVTMRQGNNTFQGQLIYYNGEDQTIILPPSKNGRAVITYHPEKS